eukprot:CAMPEP_0185174788 /NCGR_PEP_ID=MMETSP1139-20130426/25779_1 /TAXON_ID=298111 /ORGANISM="Pavlova sp., Strain CCMP459" /LENGTH=120 /DNA_ID=CAMNT_0027740511 /DNA_START=109 /DNA_END=471 /DNA_ORIENTATION=-
MIRVREVDHTRNARLDNELRALVAWEECDVDGTVLEGRGVGVQDGVKFCMTHVRVLGVKRGVTTFCPRKLVVRAAPWKSVVSDADNFEVPVDNTSADLPAGILRALSAQERNGHEVLVPS